MTTAHRNKVHQNVQKSPWQPVICFKLNFWLYNELYIETGRKSSLLFPNLSNCQIKIAGESQEEKAPKVGREREVAEGNRKSGSQLTVSGGGVRLRSAARSSQGLRWRLQQPSPFPDCYLLEKHCVVCNKDCSLLRTAACPQSFLHSVSLLIVKSKDVRKCDKVLDGGWEDGAISKLLLSNGEDLSLDPQLPSLWSQCWWGWGKGIPGACWAAGVASLQASSLRRDLVSKTMVESNCRRHLSWLLASTDRCFCSCVPTHVRAHTKSS